MRPLARLLPYRNLLLLINLLVVGLMFPGIRYALQPENEVSIWFKPDDPALINYLEFNETFGNDRIILACTCSEDGIFTREVIEEVQAATQGLHEIQGVKRVTSFLNARDVIKVREASRTTVRYTSYFSEQNLQEPAAFDSLRQAVLQAEVLKQRFINADATCYNLLIGLESFEEIDSLRTPILEEVEATLSLHLKTGDTYLGGLDIVTNGLNQITKSQFLSFLLISYVFLILLIALLFRRVVYVIYSLMSTLFSLLITLGLYGYAGFSLNIFTVIIPPLIIVLGVILIVHIINTLDADKQEGEDKVDYLVRLDKVFMPCLFASLTSMVGLVSLATSPTQVLWSFGFFAALGVAFMFTQAFLLAFPLMTLLKRKSGGKTSLFNWDLFMKRWADRLKRSSYLIIVGLVVVVLIAIRGFFLMKVDMWPITYFPEEHPVYSDHLSIEENWGYYLPLDLVLEVDSTRSLYDPVLLAGLEDFFEKLDTIDVLSASLSYHQMIQRASQVLFKKELREILTNPMLSGPFLASLRRMEIEENEYLKPELNKARIVLIGPSLTTAEVAQVAALVEDTAVNALPEFARISISGYPMLFVHIMEHALDSMKDSLFLALSLIFVLMLVLFRSFMKAVIALLPNLFTLLVLFAFMGYAGINLDLATVTLAAIVLGVSIDDTIHFVYFYEKHTGRHLPFWDRISITLQQKGKIIFMTSVILVLGFSMMLFAGLKTVFYFGLLMTFSGVAAIIGDLILLPFLLKVANGARSVGEA